MAKFLRRYIVKLRRFQAPYSERRLLLLLGDGLALFLADIITVLSWEQITRTQTYQSWVTSAIFIFSWFILAQLNDLYDIPSSLDRKLVLRRLIITLVLAVILFLIISYYLPSVVLGNTYFLTAILILTPLIIVWRFLYALIFKVASVQHRVLLVGSGPTAEAILTVLQKETFIQYQLVGYLSSKKSRSETLHKTLPWLGKIKSIEKIIESDSIDEIVVATEGKIKTKLFNKLVDCQARGVHVSWMPELYANLCHRVPIQYIGPEWALYVMQNRAVFKRLQLALKRGMDLGIVLFSLPLLGLLFPLIALCIKIDSPGPIFYRQTRCGRGGTNFDMIKFRTMVADAEKDGKARWATSQDPRITRVGRFLRKARFDELPQMLNILRGEMSLIGPRPERPEFVRQLEKKIAFYSTRSLVKPGLTGWAQVNYDYGNSDEDALMKLQYDFYYLRYWSFWLDLYILFRTVGVVLGLKGI